MNITKKKDWQYSGGLIIIIIANICFYTLKTMNLYLILSALGMLLIFGKALIQNNFVIRIDRCVMYLTLIYAMFTVYGCFFLRFGEYNWDKMLFTYFLNLAIYTTFCHLIKNDDWPQKLVLPFTIATIFSVVYLVVVEKNNLIADNVRIGNSLSGNVNTVGVCLGILSFFLAFGYCTGTKRKTVLIVLYIVTILIMLLTGSKKTIVLLFLGLILIMQYSSGKTFKLIMIITVVGLIIYSIFAVPYFYNIIGFRIVDFVGNFFHLKTVEYSYSTESRMNMISEGVRIFLNHPIFGGGEKYFGLLTKSGFSYSHCNYTEMLCNFGIVGTLVFYLPYFTNIHKLRKNCKNVDGRRIGISLLIASLILGWMMVIYSDLCINYIPIILSYALLRKQENSPKYSNKKSTA